MLMASEGGTAVMTRMARRAAQGVLFPLPERASAHFLRRCPDDFEVVFVEQGRLECEAWYRCRRTTVTRWLEECGKERLITRRKAFVSAMRKQGKWLTRASNMVEHRQPRKTVREQISDSRRVSPRIARRAADYLRCVRNGGWIITHAADGNWRVGSRLRSPAELVDLAERKGFDLIAANLQMMAEGED